jgi:hypothetical protein
VLGAGCWLKPTPSTRHLEPDTLGSWQGRPESNRHVSRRREPRVGTCCIAFMLRPCGSARGETRTLTEHVLSMPPLPAWATRARDARGGSRTRTETLFERATSAVWVTRALLRTDTGGGIRTLKNRRLRTVCQPIAPLPRAMLEEGFEPSTGFSCPRRSRRRAFAIYATPAFVFRLRDENSGGRTRTPTACSKDRRPAFRRPRKETNPARLERAPSGVAGLRSDPSELRVRKGSDE